MRSPNNFSNLSNEAKEHANTQKFLLTPFNPDELFELISKKLKKSYSTVFDDVPAFLIKRILSAISSPLTHLVNLSFCNGLFPEHIKTGKVIPIYKKGDRQNVTNYRPVTIPSVFSKIFEYCYLHRLNTFLQDNEIISKKQHGFQASKSTISAVRVFYNTLVDLISTGECPVGIFCDLSRAFDCVDHSILLSKLFDVGIQDNALDWVKTFVAARKQYVTIKDVSRNNIAKDFRSNLEEINVGVPQGSILGPTLFLLYVNNIENVSPEAHCTVYADDTSFIVSDIGDKQLINKCNDLLQNINTWFAENSLYLNSEKTHCIRFHNRQKNIENWNLHLNNQVIDSCNSVKFLGIHIDECLTWRTHCEAVISKLNSINYMIKNLRSVLTQDQLIMFYYGQVESRLRYGIVFWGASTSSGDVLIAQKKIVRSISGVSRLTNCKPIFKNLSILTLPSLYILELCSHIFINQNHFIKNENMHSFNTRQKMDFHIPYSKNKLSYLSPDTMAIRLFNVLPTELKKCKTLGNFKYKLKTLLTENPVYSVQEFYNI